MKLPIYLIIGILTCLQIQAQNFEKLVFSKIGTPTYLINKNIIGNLDILQQIPQEKIKKVEILKIKNDSIDEYKNIFPNLSQYGLILVEVDSKFIETKTQNDIRFFLDVNPQTPIYVDGFLIKNETFLIATKSIKEIEIIEPTAENLISQNVINIWTIKKEERVSPKHIEGIILRK